MDEDCRATQIYNTSKQQYKIAQILQQLQKSKHINAFFVLSKYLDCPQIKNEPQFNHIIFQKHQEIVMQLLQWTLIPKQLIKKKKIKTNVGSYPHQCKQFIKDNWCFYEYLYIAIRMNKFQFKNIFNFLRKQYFDKSTIYTALGYFSDVMIPFVKYQFSASYNLTKLLTQVVAVDPVETYSFLKILNQELIDQIIGYFYYQQIFQFIKTVVFVGLQDSTQVQFAKQIFRKLLISLKNLSIKGSQTSNNKQRLIRTIDSYQNISNFLKQLLQSSQKSQKQLHSYQRQAKQSKITKQTTLQNLPLIQCIVQENILQYFVEQLKKFIYYGGNIEKQRVKLHSSAQLQMSNQNKVKNQRQELLAISMNMTTNSKVEKCIEDAEEQQAVEVVLKILGSLVEIYHLLPKKVSKGIQFFSQVSQPLNFQTVISPSTPTSSPSGSPYFSSYAKKLKKTNKQVDCISYTSFMTSFNKQIQFLFNEFQVLTRLVINVNILNKLNNSTSNQNDQASDPPNKIHNEQNTAQNITKIIPFSSGQNIKKISFMKYQFFCLLAKSMKLYCTSSQQSIKIQQKITKSQKIFKQTQSQTQQQPKQHNIKLPGLVFPIQKLHIIQIIKKYICQNKWNNIAQIVLLQICQSLVTNFYDYVKKILEVDKMKKFTNSFLSFLIQNFNKRDYVFLNTVKFTSQGNLYALYKMSKDLANTLNITNQLSTILNQFQPWKKFILSDLKNYQQRLFPKAILPDIDNDNNQEMNIKIDEADSIKKLVQNISYKKYRRNDNIIRSKSLAKSSHTPSSDSIDQMKLIKSLSPRKQQIEAQKIKRQYQIINQFKPGNNKKVNQQGNGKDKDKDNDKKIIKRGSMILAKNNTFLD